MEKIKKIVFTALLAAVVSVTAACGRNNADNGNGTTAGTSKALESSGETGMEQTSATDGTAGESGGVLRDMVDGVEDGLNDLGNDLEPGGAAGGENPVN